MKSQRKIYTALAVQLLICSFPKAQNTLSGIGSTTSLVATFESMSIRLTYGGDDNGNANCGLEYKEESSSTWQTGHPLWADRENKEFRGSVVYLTPGTAYNFRFTATDPDNDEPIVTTGSQSTWTETKTEAQTGFLNDRITQMNITQGGTAEVWALYAPLPGTRATIHVTGTDAMVIDANYVIVRNVDFIGGTQRSIKINNDRHDIIIEHCTFTGFGAEGKAQGPNTFPDEKENTAILVGDRWEGSNVSRVIIQYNRIFDPAGGSNSWDQGHPTGPHGIYFLQTAGNHVVRYNTIRSKINHWYNDCIGGAQNFSTSLGNLNQDSDIYGNFISQCWDDGIEAEGRNVNVRIWGNYIDSTNVAIASGAVTAGPLYVFRNIYVNSMASEEDPDKSGTGFKVGWGSGTQGPQFTYHNTLTGPHAASNAISASAGPLYNHRSRNNIFDVRGTAIYDKSESTTNSFDYDLIPNGSRTDVHESNYQKRLTGRPRFACAPPTGEIKKSAFSLQELSIGYQKGQSVPGFSLRADGSQIPNPSIGAFDSRFPPLLIGHLKSELPCELPSAIKKKRDTEKNILQKSVNENNLPVYTVDGRLLGGCCAPDIPSRESAGVLVGPDKKLFLKKQ